MTGLDLLKELERDYHLQLSGSRLNDIAARLENEFAVERGKVLTLLYDEQLKRSTAEDQVAALQKRISELEGTPSRADLDAVAADQEAANATE